MSTTNHRHERIGEEIAHEINAMLAGELKDLRRLPDLHFTLDVSEESAERIEKLLKEVKKGKPSAT